MLLNTLITSPLQRTGQKKETQNTLQLQGTIQRTLCPGNGLALERNTLKRMYSIIHILINQCIIILSAHQQMMRPQIQRQLQAQASQLLSVLIFIQMKEDWPKHTEYTDTVRDLTTNSQCSGFRTTHIVLAALHRHPVRREWNPHQIVFRIKLSGIIDVRLKERYLGFEEPTAISHVCVLSFRHMHIPTIHILLHDHRHTTLRNRNVKQTHLSIVQSGIIDQRAKRLLCEKLSPS